MDNNLKTSDFLQVLSEVGSTNRLFLQATMEMQIDELKDYIVAVERAFEERSERETKEPKQPPAGLSEDEYEIFYQKQSRIYYSFKNAFPRLVRRTAFIHLYSILEQRLIFLCDCVYKRGHLSVPHSANTKDKGIVKAQKYLKTVGGVPFPDQSEEWEEIHRMNELRNRYTHGGRNKKVSAELLAYCERNKQLIQSGISNRGVSKQVVLKVGYCQHAIEIVRQFHEKVLMSIPDDLLG